MFKRIVFNAVIFGVAISIGWAIPPATAATKKDSSTQKPGIFDLSSLDDAHRNLVKDALGAFDYDWSRLRPALRSTTGKMQIPIRIRDISSWNAVGLSWPGGTIVIDDQVRDDLWFQQIVMHEVGHMVDFFHLSPAGLHDEVAEIYGAPWGVMGHNFNNGFIQVFSTYEAFDASYPMTQSSLVELRELLGGSDKIPEKVV
jgi:hypothetical protein